MEKEVAFHWCERMVSSHWSVKYEGASYWSTDSCFSMIRKKRNWDSVSGAILSLKVKIVMHTR